MVSIKNLLLTLGGMAVSIICYCQSQLNNENSDEPKILKNVLPFTFIDEPVMTSKIPKRKYDSPFFCDEMEQYKNGFIINSITSSRGGGKIDFTTNFYYYDLIENSIKRISIFEADTIESILSSGTGVYYSVIKNGKRNIGCLSENQYHNLLDKASDEIRNHIDTAKWIKLGYDNDRLFVLSPGFLYEVTSNQWKSLVKYSFEEFCIKVLKYKRGFSMLPTKNIVISDNAVYFLQEVVQDRTCKLFKLNITNGLLEDYFLSLDYRDNYLKQVNDFVFLNDSSLLVASSRLIGSNMLINKKEDKINVWMFENSIATSTGAKIPVPVTTFLKTGDTLVLASYMGLYSKYSNVIKPLLYFDNYHQEIKDKGDLIDFPFEPRSIKKVTENIYLIGGMWGGLYEANILKGTVRCLDDINFNKIKTVDLSSL